ncbi:MAG: ABC transporter [Gemmatimonadales bacterium]|nr:MAG: ABC transporter [Gemmatimonadales bacterium]
MTEKTLAQKRKLMSLSGLGIMAVLFVAVIILSNNLFRSARLDLTESGLYSLSDGTKAVLEKIDEPINLYFFFSQEASRENPFLRDYATRVREFIEEFVAQSDGKLQLTVVDPVPFSEEEDRAAEFGLQAVPINVQGDSIYLGLAGTNSVDDVMAMPFFQPDKETFLEYDLARLVFSLAHPKKPIIGVISGLPIMSSFDPMTGRPIPGWTIIEQIQQLFDVSNLGIAIDSVDDDVDLLMVVHPKNLSDTTRFAIDQFVLGGGRALVFVDPFSEADQPRQDPSNPMAAVGTPRDSDLPDLLQAWGVGYDKQFIVGDAELALSINVSPNQPPIRHLAIPSFTGDYMNRDEIISADLERVIVGTAGFLTKSREDDTLQFVPLLTSSIQSAPINADRFMFMPDPSVLFDGFVPTGEQYVVAARVRGPATTAFPDGPPGQNDEEGDEEDQRESEYLTESVGDINVVVFADADLLADRFWVQTQNFLGRRLSTAFASNGDLVVNSLDVMAGSEDLIGVRSRASYSRPFLRVEELQRTADAQFRTTEQGLQQELREMERRLTELQAQREDAGSLVLTEEQRVELQRFQDERIRIRKELRLVRHDLNQDIDRLGTRLKFVNIALVPILLSVLALAALFIRVRRNREGLAT